MSDFRKLSDTVFASPQIELTDIEAAKAMGVSLIVNNRPDGEEPSAPQGAEIEAAAAAAGVDYVAISIGHSAVSVPQFVQMIAALGSAVGASLAYCLSVSRATFLWALAQAKSSGTPDEIVEAAMAAGYDVGPIRPMLDMLAAR